MIVIFMVAISLENLETSGNEICVTEKLENLEKSENFNERIRIRNNAYSN